MATSSLIRPLGMRALHLRIVPRPANLSESREILRLVATFGEVEYFKTLKYDAQPSPNTAFAIFKDEAAANELLKQSPVRFRLERGGVEAREAAADLVQHARTSGRSEEEEGVEEEATKSADPPSPDGTPSASPTQPPFAPSALSQTRHLSTATKHKQSPRIFQIQANLSRLSLRDAVNIGHYHGSFCIDSKTAAQEDLARRVPLLGQSDINLQAPDKPVHVLEREQARWRDRRTSLIELFEEGAKAG